MRRLLVKWYNLPVIKVTSSGDLMYSVVTIADDVSYT